MKRDMDLIRAILLAVESSPSGLAPKIEIPGYTQEQIGYHAILLDEAGLAKAINITHHGSKSPEGVITQLTWAGHEFLDSSRDKKIWKQAKGIAKKAGGVSFQILTAVLTELIKQKAGL